ncbi:MAG: cytidylate kinase-like family protein [Oscillospiraceae bacterium]
MEKKLIVTIAREFGSGGREIGLGLSKALGIAFYDKEILKKAAQESGIVEELFENADEKPTNSFLYSLSLSATPLRNGGFTDYSDYLTNDKLFLIQSKTIKDIADRESCVIIGRCSDYVLRGYKGLFSIYIHAPLEMRIQRIARMQNIDEDAARALIKKTDKNRANYYSFYSDKDWGSAHSYDLSIDAGRFGTEGSIEIIKNACQYAAK